MQYLKVAFVCYHTYMSMHDSVLKIHKLTKDFGNHKGIFDVSFTAGPGEIIGFVGPNGAGKSTTINAVTGLISPDSGTVEIFGKSVTPTSTHTLMRQLGIMYSESILDETKTAGQLFTDTEKLLGANCKETWQSMAKQFGLDTDKKIKKLSLGNKKKVAAIKVLMHKPSLIVMDEPTSGLDPIIKDGFMELLRSASSRGATILLSSHDLSEVQHICTRIIMIKAGNIIIDDATEAILSKLLRRFRLISPGKELRHILTTLDVVVDAKAEDDQLILHTSDFQKVIEILQKAKFYNYFIEQPSLEDAFKEKYV